MKAQSSLFAVALLICMSTHAVCSPSGKAMGIADCFNQKISFVLNSLSNAVDYVCTVNLAHGSPLPGSYDPFGSNNAFPLVAAAEGFFFEVYYATPDGGYCAVARNTSDPTGQTFDGFYVIPGSNQRLKYALDLNTGALTGELLVNLTYNPAQRPWYLSTVAADGLYVTSTPYIFVFATANGVGLGITASRKCFRSGTFEIAAAADARLSLVSLARSDCSSFDNSTSVVYVVNGNGILVLQSDLALTTVDSAVNASTPLVKAAATWAAQQNFQDGSVSWGEFTYASTTYEYYSRPVTPSSGSWDWTLVVVQPASGTCSSGISLRPWWIYSIGALLLAILQYIV